MIEPNKSITVELVHATSEQQIVKTLEVPSGSTIDEVLNLAGVEKKQEYSYGIFAKLRSLTWQVEAGDRIEVYRPLPKTPNQLRLERARQAAKLGNRQSGVLDE